MYIPYFRRAKYGYTLQYMGTRINLSCAKGGPNSIFYCKLNFRGGGLNSGLDGTRYFVPFRRLGSPVPKLGTGIRRTPVVDLLNLVLAVCKTIPADKFTGRCTGGLLNLGQWPYNRTRHSDATS